MKQRIESSSISHEFALHILRVALEEGRTAGVNAVVTVVDPALATVAYVRADGATPHSEETSRRKAQTAASTRKPTGWMNSEQAVALPLGTGTLLTNVAGGFPLTFEGTLLGGLGVAGGPPEVDAQIAKTILARIGADV